MRVGISTASFFGKAPTEEALNIINEMGIEAAEVFLTTFCEYEKSFGEMLVERVGKIDVVSVHTLNQQFEPELFNPVQRTRDDSEFFFKKAAEVAAMLGAKYYTFHGPARLKRRPYVFDYEKLGKRVDEIALLLKRFGAGCELSYENVHWTYFNSPEFFINLKKYSEVKTCLDIKQAMQSGISMFEYIDAMGDRLVNCHLCDYNSEGKLSLPGKGEVDFTSLFKYLLEKGYKGDFIMEVYGGDYKDYDEIYYSYEYLKKCLKTAEGDMKTND